MRNSTTFTDGPRTGERATPAAQWHHTIVRFLGETCVPLLRRWILRCILLSGLVASQTAWADFRAAEQALAIGQFDRVHAELAPLVRAGDARALNLLGVLYQNGWGLARDPAAAAGFYRRAAEQGLTRAIHNLGRMYRSGLGVPPDAGEAARLWKIAGRQGYVTSQAALGALYHAGDGVPRDMFRAYFWWSLAAWRLDLEAVRAREDIIYTLTAHEKDVADRLVREFVPDR